MEHDTVHHGRDTGGQIQAADHVEQSRYVYATLVHSGDAISIASGRCDDASRSPRPCRRNQQRAELLAAQTVRQFMLLLNAVSPTTSNTGEFPSERNRFHRVTSLVKVRPQNGKKSSMEDCLSFSSKTSSANRYAHEYPRVRKIEKLKHA